MNYKIFVYFYIRIIYKMSKSGPDEKAKAAAAAAATSATSVTNTESESIVLRVDDSCHDDVARTFSEFDVTKYEALRNAKKTLKHKHKNAEFVGKMKLLLKTIDVSELQKYDDNLVKFVIETVEHVFTKRRCGELKKSVSVELLTPYFDDNEVLAGKFVEMLLRDIAHSTRLSRGKNKIAKFFFYLCKSAAGV